MVASWEIFLRTPLSHRVYFDLQTLISQINCISYNTSADGNTSWLNIVNSYDEHSY